MNAPIRQILILFSVVVIFFAAADLARACTCVRDVTIDEKYDRAQVVGIFKLQSIEKREKTGELPGVNNAVFAVQRVFKGDIIKAGQEIPFKQNIYGSCSLEFSEKSIGEEFLLFQNPDSANGERTWAVGYCSGWRNITEAGGDLMYLEKLPGVYGKTRISGRLMQYFGSAVKDQPGRYEALADSPIRLRGPGGKIIKLKTDEDGFYEVYDVAPGSYESVPVTIKGYLASKSIGRLSTLITIKPKGHFEENITFYIDNSVKGRVVDSTGRAVKKVDVKLIPAIGERSEYFFGGSEHTDDAGGFEFENIPPGNYLIVVNDGGEVTADTPFGAFYYPGTGRREEASPVSMGPGEFIKNLVITAPQTADVVTISGVLLYENRKPAIGIQVGFYNDKEGDGTGEPDINRVPDEDAETDARGRFTLRIIKGRKGVIAASEYIWIHDVSHCAALSGLVRKLIDEKNEKDPDHRYTTADIYSSIIRVDAGGSQGGLELQFPFPFCRKKE